MQIKSFKTQYGSGIVAVCVASVCCCVVACASVCVRFPRTCVGVRMLLLFLLLLLLFVVFLVVAVLLCLLFSAGRVVVVAQSGTRTCRQPPNGVF